MARIEIQIEGADGKEYVLFPACAYDGNKFKSLKKTYPPMFLPEEASADMEITITDVPRLEKDGSGVIEVTTGDVATPCVAVWNKTEKRATFVYTVQEIDGKNIGLAYEKGKIILSWPAYRTKKYSWLCMYPVEAEEFIESDMEIPHKVFNFTCNSIEEFYQFYFEHRKCMNLSCDRPKILPFNEQFEIQKDKYNTMNWTGDFYDVNAEGCWQPGWVGGAMAGYALMKLGGKLERERALKTLDFLFETQAKTGLFRGVYGKGKVFIDNDGFHTPGTENWILIRKSADTLYFLFKHYELMDKVNEKYLSGSRKLTDFFVKLWRKNGQIGQFIDCETGEIVVGNSTAGAIVPAALVSAYKFFGVKEYLETAKEIADFLYKNSALNGYTTGGAGEILQCPDSESAAGLLESMVCLYEETKENKWLEYAEFMAWLCSSWIVSYNYIFPPTSEYGRLGMKTVGAVFANVQNKHAAPGFCTLSGVSLYKLYRWTQNPLYKEIYDDVTLTISQYMSTEKRPIYSWDVPHARDTNPAMRRGKLPQGFICERVNMSDWETECCVGGVFNGSCWCEATNLLFLAERKDDF